MHCQFRICIDNGTSSTGSTEKLTCTSVKATGSELAFMHFPSRPQKWPSGQQCFPSGQHIAYNHIIKIMI